MRNVKLLVVALLTMIALVSCDLFSPAVTSTTKNDEVEYYGKIVNALTLDYVTVSKASDVSVKVIYGSTTKSADVKVTESSTKNIASVMWSAKVPEYTDFIVQVVVDGYVSFEATQNQASNTQNSTSDYSEIDQRDIYLYPNSTVAEDRTYVIADAAEAIIPATGSFIATIDTSLTTGIATTFTEEYSNHRITGAITDGAFTIPAASQIYGATYTIRIYGVSGFQANSATSFTAGSAVTTNEIITLTSSDAGTNALAVTSVNWLNADGTTKEGLTALTVTFNRAIELHPALAADVVDLVSLTTTNSDGDANTISWSGGSTTAATYSSSAYDGYAQNSGAVYTTSARSSIAVSGNTVTVTMTGSVSDDAQDAYAYVFAIGAIQVRLSGTQDAFAVPADLTTYGNITQVMRNVR